MKNHKNNEHHMKKYEKIIIQNVQKFFSNVIFKISMFKYTMKNKTVCFKKMNIKKQKIAYEIDINNTQFFIYKTNSC